MNIYVCIGSSCHLKGSYDVINLLKEEVAKNQLEEKVELRASFCLGHCTDGVSVKVDETVITGVSKENFQETLWQHVLKELV